MTHLQKMTKEEWMKEVESCVHVRKGETVSYHERQDDGIVSAYIDLGNGRSVSLGCYFTRACYGEEPNSGWWHK